MFALDHSVVKYVIKSHSGDSLLFTYLNIIILISTLLVAQSTITTGDSLEAAV
jgi:hypothetical protein